MLVAYWVENREGRSHSLPTLSQIAEIGATTPGFKTLVAAVTAAGLVDELSDPDFGPVTVFAPTDKVRSANLRALFVPRGTVKT
jgi:uncharacterized surface protein with fasciclin (FAS1) repeats